MVYGKMTHKTMLSFVIPCYRSENTISDVVNEIVDTVTQRNEYDYEIILVSDHSPDAVYCVIEGLAAKNLRIKGIELSKNFGQASAMMCGYRAAKGDIIISLDDDGQNPVNEVFKLIEKLSDEVDLVFARYPDRKDNIFRKVCTFFYNTTMQILLNKPRNISITNFIACKKYVINEMLRYQSTSPFIGGLMLRTTARIANVDAHHRPRAWGSTGYTFSKLFSLWLNGFVSFSIKPLRIASVLGISCSLLGFLMGMRFVIERLLNHEIQAGFTSIIAAILFIGGVIMVMLGLIGEYVGRIFLNLNNTPQYVIRRRTFLEQDDRATEGKEDTMT